MVLCQRVFDMINKDYHFVFIFYNSRFYFICLGRCKSRTSLVYFGSVYHVCLASTLFIYEPCYAVKNSILRRESALLVR